MKKIFLLAAFIITFAFIAEAQKFGYINSQDLVSGLTEMDAADKELQTYQEQLVAKGKSMVMVLDEDYKKYTEDMQAGILSKVQSSKKEEELGKKQQEIQAYELEVQQKLQVKREELYKPILDRITNLIKEYGKENGFTMIFDSSVGSILHAVETDDLTDVIREKLKG